MPTAYAGSGFEKGHTAPVAGLAFSPDGTKLASAGADQSVILWDVAREDEKVLAVAPGNDAQYAPGQQHLGFSADGQLLVAGTAYSAAVWDVVTTQGRNAFGTARKEGNIHPPPLILSADGKTLACLEYTGHGRRFIIYNVATGQKATEFECGGRHKAVALSRDGKILAVAGDKDIKLFDAAAKRELHPIKGQDDIQEFLFSSDGAKLASIEHNDGRYTFSLWDVTRKDGPAQLRHREMLKPGGLQGLALSPDGKTVAFMSSVETILFDLADRKPRATAAGGGRAVFSPDSKVLAIVVDNKYVGMTTVSQVILADAATGQTRDLLEGEALGTAKGKGMGGTALSR